jgi:hypothetical protein
MAIYSAGDRWSNEITSSWLSLAKLARKAGNLQTAYGAVLQACQSRTLLPQIEAAKLTRATGEQHRALQELENVLRLHGVVGDDVIDVTDDPEGKRIAGKVQVPPCTTVYLSLTITRGSRPTITVDCGL